jgi:hypothetical protein
LCFSRIINIPKRLYFLPIYICIIIFHTPTHMYICK